MKQCMMRIFKIEYRIAFLHPSGFRAGQYRLAFFIPEKGGGGPLSDKLCNQRRH